MEIWSQLPFIINCLRISEEYNRDIGHLQSFQNNSEEWHKAPCALTSDRNVKPDIQVINPLNEVYSYPCTFSTSVYKPCPPNKLIAMQITGLNMRMFYSSTTHYLMFGVASQPLILL